MKKLFSKSKMSILLMLVSVIAILFAITMSVSAADGTAEGWTFNENNIENPFSVDKPITELPEAYEAVVRIPENTDGPTVIINNWYNKADRYFGLIVGANGVVNMMTRGPVILNDGSTDTDESTQIKFTGYDARGKGWIHIAVVRDTIIDEANGIYKAVYTLYVNGEEKVFVDATDTSKGWDKKYAYIPQLDVLNSQEKRSLSIGTYGGTYSRGEIKSIAVYSSPLTAEQVRSSYENGVDLGNSAISAYYDYNMSGNTPTLIKDQTGNGHDAVLTQTFYERETAVKDYAYSFAFVGDTQMLVENDVATGSSYTASIYDWIVKNKTEKNIQRVFGLGDITDDNTAAEWELAVDLHEKLENANIPYTIIPGNHDDKTSQTRYNEYFGKVGFFTSEIDGYYKSGRIENYYMKFEVGTHKYLAVALQYMPSDEVLEWANRVVADNLDRRVIVTTHYLLSANGTWSQSEEGNVGQQIWEKFISKHSNIVLSVCGHTVSNDIKHRTDIGENGNVVNTLLVNPQGFDYEHYYKTGMVAMLYFSEDGSEVQVEYISAYKTLEAQKIDPEAEDMLCKERNQFSMSLPKVDEQWKNTSYGEIPEDFDVKKYSLALFSGGYMLSGYESIEDAVSAMERYLKEDPSKDLQLLLIKNVQAPSGISLGGVFNNASGSITIDLGGYTLTSENAFFDFTYSNTINTSAVTITVKNGSVLSNADSIVKGGFASASSNASKKWSAAFESVVFTYQGHSVCEISPLNENISASASEMNISFTDCIFNIKSTRLGDAPLFNVADNKELSVKIKINGGEIVADNIGNVRLLANKNEENVIFGASDSGEYIKLITSEKMSVKPFGDDAIKNQYGVDLYFGLTTSGNEYVYDMYFSSTYSKTPLLAAQWADYPILIFRNGAVRKGHTIMINSGGNSGALYDAKNFIDGNNSGEVGTSVQILLLTDVTQDYYYSNFGQAAGTITLDLGGHKFIQNNNNACFWTQAKYANSTMHDITLNVLNGEVVINNNLLRFDANSGYQTGVTANDGKYKTFHITFDDVVFSFREGSTSTNFLASCGSNASKVTAYVGYDVKFNNCVFDLTNAQSMSTFMNAKDDNTTKNGNAIVKVVVNGCSVITSNPGLVLYETHSTNGSTVTFEKGEDGKYLKMILVGTDEVPVATANGGELVFVKISETSDSVTYRLRSVMVADVDYAPKMSLTLESQIKINVYIPVESTLKFTFDGVDYEKTYVKNVDGVDYYVVSISLPASSVAKEITLVSTVKVGDTTAKATFTFSVTKYAEKLIANGSDVEKTLARDVLAYVKAAYNYFTEFNTTEEIARVNALVDSIIGDYTSAPVSSSVINTVAPVKSVTLNLDAKPTIRFYVTDTDVDFYANGRKLNTVSGTDVNGTYVQLDVYAYVLASTITYGEGGSYHISNFLEKSAGTDHENLVACFIKYVESAANYRLSVIEGNK